MEQFAGRSCTVVINKFFQESFTADPWDVDGAFYGLTSANPQGRIHRRDRNRYYQNSLCNE